jgi:hypothetical protein
LARTDLPAMMEPWPNEKINPVLYDILVPINWLVGVN